MIYLYNMNLETTNKMPDWIKSERYYYCENFIKKYLFLK
jgi:hypothetical protein